MSLDILRGIAILLVLGAHQVVNPQEAGLLRPVAVWLAFFGWTGVDLFFVLSGFLIGGLLFNEIRRQGSLDVRRFLIRRAFKIWPSYYAYLAVILLLTFKLGMSPKLLLPFLAHLQNYCGALDIMCPHTWSLAIEEHFYLALPCILWAATRLPSARHKRVSSIPSVPILGLLLIVGCTTWRVLNSLYFSYSFKTHSCPTHLRMDSLFFGVLLAYLHSFHPALLARVAQRRGVLLTAGLALLSPMMVLDITTAPFVATFGYTFLYLGYGCILLTVVYTPVDKGWAARLLKSRLARVVAFIGVFSYPIYLWHVDIAWRLVALLFDGGWSGGVPPCARWLFAMTLFTIAAVGTGVLTGRTIERPALALRDRLFPPRAPALR